MSFVILMQPQEEWRSIPGYEGQYEVSSLGRVSSLPRILTNGHRWKGGIRKLRADRDGYPRVNFAPDDTHRVADLVLAAFCGPKPDGMVARHKNRDRSDCRAENLIYGTPDQNRLDAYAHGTFSKLTAHEAIELRQRAEAGESLPSLAVEFGLHYQSAYKIARRKRWGDFLDRNRNELLGPDPP